MTFGLLRHPQTKGGRYGSTSIVGQDESGGGRESGSKPHTWPSMQKKTKLLNGGLSVRKEFG